MRHRKSIAVTAAFAAVLLSSCTTAVVGSAESGSPPGKDGHAVSPADESSSGSVAGRPDAGEGPSAAGNTASPRAASRIVVNGDGYGHVIDVDAVRRWARDVEERNASALIRKCWTYPPNYIRERYLGPEVAELAEALSRPPMGADAGVIWESGGLSVSVSWAEGRSVYACPSVSSGRDDGSAPDDLVGYRVKRFILRQKGRPVSPEATENAYPLRCGIHRGDVSGADRADPADISVRTGPGYGWTVTAGAVVFDVAQEPGLPCIVAATMGD